MATSKDQVDFPSTYGRDEEEETETFPAFPQSSEQQLIVVLSPVSITGLASGPPAPFAISRIQSILANRFGAVLEPLFRNAGTSHAPSPSSVEESVVHR